MTAYKEHTGEIIYAKTPIKNTLENFMDVQIPGKVCKSETTKYR